jgi:hypothetical protein
MQKRDGHFLYSGHLRVMLEPNSASASSLSLGETAAYRVFTYEDLIGLLTNYKPFRLLVCGSNYRD